MAIYVYEVPVMVYYVGDESETLLSTKLPITRLVSRSILPSWVDFFPKTVIRCEIESRKDRLIVKLHTESNYTPEERDALLGRLNEWMHYGYFEGGKYYMGRYYGYPYSEIVVRTWDEKLPITPKNETLDNETQQ